MKKAILILSLFLCFTAFGQNYPDSGFTNKAEAKNLKANGKKKGKWVEYTYLECMCDNPITSDTNAPFYILSIYKTDKVFGTLRIYYRSGKLLEEVPYVKGKKNWVARWYYESGKLLRETPFIGTKENGVEKEYYEDGKIRMLTTYKNGKVKGGVSYDESGKEIKSTSN